MIRDGSYGSNFLVKLINSIVCLTICLVYKKVKKRNDYFWIFLTGTFLWTLVEVVLQLTGARETPQVFLFGWELPMFLQVLIQGISEGAFVAILGILFADLFLEKKSRIWGAILFLAYNSYLVVDNLLRSNVFKNVGGDVTSRRDMFTPASIIYLSIMIIIGIIWFIKADRESRIRGLMMMGVLIVMVTAWTATQVWANTRWIEIGPLSDLTRAPPIIEILVLAYDIIVEICLAYLPYYAIPWMLINWKKKRDEK